MGRPTDYNEEILAKSLYYVENYEELEEEIPSIEGLAGFLEIARSTIYDWRSHEDKTEFSYILDMLLAKQAKVLINKGLSNKFNSTITKLILTKHDYSDKQQTDITTQGEKMEGVVILPPKNENQVETPKETGDSTS